MIVVYFLAAQVVMALFFYPLLVVGKRADEEMGILFERRFQENNTRDKKLYSDKRVKSSRRQNSPNNAKWNDHLGKQFGNFF